ncbi:MAG: putative motility protein [Mariprofundaceae bacterium]
MDMGLVAGISAMQQSSAAQSVQLATFNKIQDLQQVMAAELLKAMPSVDANPAIGKNLNVVG